MFNHAPRKYISLDQFWTEIACRCGIQYDTGCELRKEMLHSNKNETTSEKAEMRIEVRRRVT